MKVKISSLQAELKKIQKQHKKHRSELESLVDAREKLKSDKFFSVMRSQNVLGEFAHILRLFKTRQIKTCWCYNMHYEVKYGNGIPKKAIGNY